MPLLIDPVVMNQNTSPSDADWVGPFDNAGTLPVPRPLTPWQELQRANVGQLQSGAVLEPAVKYQRLAQTLGVPRHSH